MEKKCFLLHTDAHLSIHAIVHTDQMSIMNFEDTFLQTCITFEMFFAHDFKVSSGRFRFGSFLNDRLKWSVRVVLGMLKVGTLLLSIDYKAAFSCILTCQIKNLLNSKLHYFIHARSYLSKSYDCNLKV